MTKMVRVKIENSDKKSVYEINHWALNKSNCDVVVFVIRCFYVLV